MDLNKILNSPIINLKELAYKMYGGDKQHAFKKLNDKLLHNQGKFLTGDDKIKMYTILRSLVE